ncbi:MAG TPA: MgtC/SapB family protein [Planctomycetota bacterium]|nr:MgtC/SapB family protein [Planctomycetota bacterium]
MDDPLVQSLEIAWKIGLAGLFGGLIGLERERHAQAAGLRTHFIVAAASCLIMLVSMHMRTIDPAADPGRIGAQVVSGIGFLGAGAILRFGFTVRGLTTASSLWASAGIGLAVGSGLVAGAGVCTVMVLLALTLLDVFEKSIVHGKRIGRISIVSQDRPAILGEIEACLGRHDVSIKKVGMRRGIAEKKLEVDVDGGLPDKINLQLLSSDLSGLQGVEQVEIS